MDSSKLRQIYLDQTALNGFRNFINAWIYADGTKTFVLDPGPRSTIPVLLNALEQGGITHIDYILLTHIHIDHAGGTGELLRHYPGAQVICHPAGIKHMVKPEALWQGSLKVLGHVAQAYGEIVPVDPDKIGFQPQLEDLDIKVLQTPGHAAHHLSFVMDDLLMAGEVAGVCCNTPGGIYLRPATPPRFDLDTALRSLDLVMRQHPRSIIFAHSTMQENAMELLAHAKTQLNLWVRGVSKYFEKSDQEQQKQGEIDARFHQYMYAWLMEHDHYFARVETLPGDIQERETYFLGNSLNGIATFVQSLTPAQRQKLADINV